MNKRERSARNWQLALLFSAVVFLIMLLSFLVAFCLSGALYQLGVLGGRPHLAYPVLLFAFSSLVIGTVISILFCHRPLAPVYRTMDAIDRVTEGDYSVRLALSGPRDLRKLADKFNRMVEELSSVELLRSDFVNDFSHEFKTPIVSICGFARLLKRDDLTDEERAEYLDIILRESERLAVLSANVLDLSRLESQAILTDCKRYDLSEQLRLVIALLERKWDEKRLTLRFACGECFVTANEELMRQVWINLLDNAIKFSPPGGRIELRLTQADGGVAVQVADQGCGVPAQAAAHIFDKFYQADPSHATKGNGLGLSIARRIMELHGGTLRLAHTGPEGTVFEVFLPDRAAA